MLGGGLLIPPPLSLCNSEALRPEMISVLWIDFSRLLVNFLCQITSILECDFLETAMKRIL